MVSLLRHHRLQLCGQLVGTATQKMAPNADDVAPPFRVHVTS
jgi:hypothetical protein